MQVKLRSSVIGGIPRRRLGARNGGKPAVRSSVKPSSAANNNLIDRTRKVGHNGVTIAVHANNYRSVRGRTLLCAIFDEVAFWRDDSSATPDVETFSAVLPSLSTGGGLLIGM